MPRPTGRPGWALLALACAALLAVAVIPRGVVRTIEAVQLADPVTVPDDAVRAEAPSDDPAELPGVRAVVSREERDVDLPPAPLGTTEVGPALLQAAADPPTERSHEPPRLASQLAGTASGSRAPPPSI
jgi:hypothetical protein